MDLSKNLSIGIEPMTTKPTKMLARNAKVQLTDPETGKTRTMKALGAAARRIYRKQILAGTDPAFVLASSPSRRAFGSELPALESALGSEKLDLFIGEESEMLADESEMLADRGALGSALFAVTAA